MLKKTLFVLIILGLVKWWYTDPSIAVGDVGLSFDYIIRYPQGGSSDDSLPMLVALHGNGDSAANFFETALDEVTIASRIVLIKGPLPYGSGRSWPWSPAEFAQFGPALNDAIALLRTKFPTRGKPVLLGFSGGGMMAYYQAVTHGNSYAYVFPISGQLSEEMLDGAEPSPGAVVHGFHGKSDAVLSVGGGRNAAKLLRAMGVRVTLTEFEGGHHGLFTNMKAEITAAVEAQLAKL